MLLCRTTSPLGQHRGTSLYYPISRAAADMGSSSRSVRSPVREEFAPLSLTFCRHSQPEGRQTFSGPPQPDHVPAGGALSRRIQGYSSGKQWCCLSAKQDPGTRHCQQGKLRNLQRSQFGGEEEDGQKKNPHPGYICETGTLTD